MSDKTNEISAGEQELYPVLPLRDIVVFPYMIVPLFVGREKSINALEEVMRADKHILLAAQKNAADDEPSPDAIYEVGTLATVLQLLKLPDGTARDGSGLLVEDFGMADNLMLHGGGHRRGHPLVVHDGGGDIADLAGFERALAQAADFFGLQ